MNSCSGDQVNLFVQLYINPFSVKCQDIFKSVPKITLVMVNVKTSERFFSGDGNNIRNVNAGTLISEDVVSANYDFYIISQQSNRGTSVPNHYRVIYSTSSM